MVWARLRISIDAPEIQNIKVQGVARKQDYDWTSSSSDLNCTSDRSMDGDITIKPVRGFLGIECGVGCNFTLTCTSGKAFIGEIKGVIDIPASGSLNDLCEVTMNSTGIPLNVEYFGKCGTGNAHLYKITLSTQQKGYRTFTYVRQDGGLKAWQDFRFDMATFAIKAGAQAGLAAL